MKTIITNITKISKKADMEWKFSGIILALVSFFLVLTFGGTLFAQLRTPAGDEACRDAIVFTNYVAEKIPGSSIAKKLPRACQYEQVEIDEKDPVLVEKQLVKLMERCWYKMGSGEVNPFAENLALTKTSCFLCFVVKPTELASSIYDPPFVSHLQNMYRSEGESYYTYFNLGTAPVGDERDEKAVLHVPLTRGEHYGIVFWSTSAPALASSSKGKIVLQRLGIAEEDTSFFMNTLYITDLDSAMTCYDPGWFSAEGQITP